MSDIAFQQTADIIARIVENVERVIVGKKKVIQRTVVSLMSGGHVLFDDVAGVGKTMLARALAVSIGGQFRRVQFTPDLLPSDVTGISVYNQQTCEFSFRPGPVFANMLLADEINRSSPRTQSALLEAMGERQVTVDGETYELGRPYMVLATQNPIEIEGIYPLPESQLDRFTMRLSIGYPSRDDEKAVVERQLLRHPIEALKPVTTPEQVVEMEETVARCHVADGIYDYALQIVIATRESEHVEVGASPRGTIALVRCAQALSVLEGRDFCTPDDVKRLAVSCLAHRIILKAEARLQGLTGIDLVKTAVDAATVAV
jgi:MoxR-like ATPase